MDHQPRSRPAALSGVRILVGRARSQAGAFASELRRRGAQVSEIPFIEIRRPRSYRPLDSALYDLATYDWLILTSVNGVEAFWQRMKKLGLTRRQLRHLQVAAIGPATRKALKELGIRVDLIPEEYVAESVVQALGAQVKGKRVLLARARIGRDVIPKALRRLGARLDVVEVYETVMPKSSRARLRAMLANIPFTSSSSVDNFLALTGRGRKHTKHLADVRIASIGPATSATLRRHGLAVNAEAEAHTVPGLIQAICRICAR